MPEIFNTIKLFFKLAALLFLAGMIYFVAINVFKPQGIEPEAVEQINKVIKDAMQISTPTYYAEDLIPVKYTCDGDNVNPELKISDVPEGAKSLVLIFDDPDAPAGTWTHWIVWNIDPETTEIAENSVPQGGREGTTSFKRIGYGGPCPHTGAHRYFFKLYALDAKLDLAEGAGKEELESAMAGHILAQAEYMGIYRRK